ncbi:hypothetical protein FACS189419_03930 [Planctomycetales bacterium]|nr:hypothetical protein FACS189419_03930 [Planctomycetales bacterium]
MMKYCFCVIAVLSLFAVSLSSAEDGIEMFVQACKHQGRNPVMFYSGYADMEYEKTEKPYIPVFTPNDGIADYEKQYYAELAKKDVITTRYRSSLLFLGGSADTQLRKINSMRFDERYDKKWKPTRLGISKTTFSWGKQTKESARWDNSISFMEICKNDFWHPRFWEFGRLQGGPTVMATLTLLEMREPERFRFTPNGIKRLRDSFERKEKESGYKIFKIKGKTQYDDNKATATVIESSAPDGTVTVRFWIDASRDYVCPLIQYFDTKGKLLEEHKSSNYFLCNPPGYWYPENYVYTKNDPQTDKLVQRESYNIDKKTFWLNRNITEADFYMDVPAGLVIHDDERVKNSRRYYDAVENGILSFAEGHIDLTKQKWLEEKVYAEAETNSKPKEQLTPLVRIILTVTGAVLILAAIIIMIIKKFRTPPLILLPLLLFIGCNAQPDIPQGKVTVEPAVLDFGQKRPADSPVQVEFKLHNNTDKPLTITDVSSGCGCTAMEYPKEPIAPKATVAVPVKINLLGRFGDFTNKIKVKTDADETYEVDVKGKIVNDLWITESSLRCTSEGGQPAKGLLEVHTVDYPDVKFDFTGIDKRLTVKELGRNTKDGETVIKFDVAPPLVHWRHLDSNRGHADYDSAALTN